LYEHSKIIFREQRDFFFWPRNEANQLNAFFLCSEREWIEIATCGRQLVDLVGDETSPHTL
jgi:hypothetical protein